MQEEVNTHDKQLAKTIVKELDNVISKRVGNSQYTRDLSGFVKLIHFLIEKNVDKETLNEVFQTLNMIVRAENLIDSYIRNHLNYGDSFEEVSKAEDMYVGVRYYVREVDKEEQANKTITDIDLVVVDPSVLLRLDFVSHAVEDNDLNIYMVGHVLAYENTITYSDEIGVSDIGGDVANYIDTLLNIYRDKKVDNSFLDELSNIYTQLDLIFCILSENLDCIEYYVPSIDQLYDVQEYRAEEIHSLDMLRSSNVASLVDNVIEKLNENIDNGIILSFEGENIHVVDTDKYIHVVKESQLINDIELYIVSIPKHGGEGKVTYCSVFNKSCESYVRPDEIPESLIEEDIYPISEALEKAYEVAVEKNIREDTLKWLQAWLAIVEILRGRA